MVGLPDGAVLAGLRALKPPALMLPEAPDAELQRHGPGRRFAVAVPGSALPPCPGTAAAR